jgi:hypothetical protein
MGPPSPFLAQFKFMGSSITMISRLIRYDWYSGFNLFLNNFKFFSLKLVFFYIFKLFIISKQILKIKNIISIYFQIKNTLKSNF